MIKLSVVIITYNEEKNLERCLLSVKRVADEIVILDSFSTDRTMEIAQRFNAKFFTHTFDGHIQQKNRAITYATHPYILSLDADEALDDELQESILKIKSNCQHNGYYMNRFNNYCGKWIKHGGWYPDRKLRLFKSSMGTWGGINPHDKYELNDKNESVGQLKGNILHYSYYTTDEHIKQTKYFSDIAAKDLLKRNYVSYPLLKLLFSPPARFIKQYFINLGFLDGYYGFVIAKTAAWGTYIKYKYFLELKKTKLGI